MNKLAVYQGDRGDQFRGAGRLGFLAARLLRVDVILILATISVVVSRTAPPSGMAEEGVADVAVAVSDSCCSVLTSKVPQEIAPGLRQTKEDTGSTASSDITK